MKGVEIVASDLGDSAGITGAAVARQTGNRARIIQIGALSCQSPRLDRLVEAPID